MTSVLEALYVVTTISAIITLGLLWRERSARRSGVRRAAHRWAGLTVGLAVLCVSLYWYLSPR
jgi:hypothetical protein